MLTTRVAGNDNNINLNENFKYPKLINWKKIENSSIAIVCRNWDIFPLNKSQLYVCVLFCLILICQLMVQNVISYARYPTATCLQQMIKLLQPVTIWNYFPYLQYSAVENKN